MSELVDSVRRVRGLLNAFVQMERESSTLDALLDLDLGYLIDEDARKGELRGGSTPAVGGGGNGGGGGGGGEKRTHRPCVRLARSLQLTPSIRYARWRCVLK